MFMQIAFRVISRARIARRRQRHLVWRITIRRDQPSFELCRGFSRLSNYILIITIIIYIIYNDPSHAVYRTYIYLQYTRNCAAFLFRGVLFLFSFRNQLKMLSPTFVPIYIRITIQSLETFVRQSPESVPSVTGLIDKESKSR